MIISSGNVQMASARKYSHKVQQSSTVFSWTQNNASQSQSTIAGKTIHLSMYDKENGFYFYNRFGAETKKPLQAVKSNPSTNLEEEANIRSNHMAMFSSHSFLLELLFKARFKLSLSLGGGFVKDSTLSLTSSLTPTVWNRLEVNSYFMEEKETTAFAGKGNVITADGRSISFDVTMEMSRSFCESCEFANFSQYEQILTDPLVINLDDNPTSISNQTFLFDLDCDGKKEEIAQLSQGRGYLSLDLNGDGTINDGSELFGPSTGNGFSELAKYDSDNNGWIDEADEIFSKLRVWTKDVDGKDRLLTLKDANVGAICLKNARTDFSLNDALNNRRGQVRSTGIYLRENGQAGTIQQVDF